jgi:prophage tail gpP-like protein
MAVKLNISGRDFEFFQSGSVQLNYDKIGSTFSLQAYFDDQNPDHVQLFKPLSFPEVILTDIETGEILITGTGLGNTFPAGPAQELVTLSGYSKSGVLGDSNVPVTEYPLELRGLTLRQICEKLIAPFGIGLVVQDEAASVADEVINKITAETNETVAGFISKTAAQKNLILTHDSNGDIVLAQNGALSEPIASFIDGAPGIKMNLQTSGQGMHSDITVQKQSQIKGSNRAQETFNNPFVINTFRSVVKEQSSGTDVNTRQAVRRAAAQEYKNIKLNIELDRWYWVNDRDRQIIRPNTVIEVEAPRLFLFQKTKFFVESVSLSFDSQKETASINCVIPEVYNDQDPVNFFDV